MAKIIRRTIGLLTLGYAAGLLTAPSSGKQTREKLKQAASHSTSEVEQELKKLYKETSDAIKEFSKDNPKVTDKLKQAKKTAELSQAKLKQLISAVKGRDNIDDDLSEAIGEAKKAVNDLLKFVKKS